MSYQSNRYANAYQFGDKLKALKNQEITLREASTVDRDFTPCLEATTARYPKWVAPKPWYVRLWRALRGV